MCMFYNREEIIIQKLEDKWIHPETKKILQLAHLLHRRIHNKKNIIFF